MTISQLFSATNHLIDQQFYNGQDIIIGRTPEISLKISNSGQIVRKFKDLFNQNLDLFLEGKYLEFLKLFKRIKGIDENYIREIYQDLQLKFESIKEAQNINEDDPKQAANVMRRLSEISGLNLGKEMKEAIERMEAGEDPEKIEEEMGHILEEQPLTPPEKRLPREKPKAPRKDETLYDLGA